MIARVTSILDSMSSLQIGLFNFKQVAMTHRRGTGRTRFSVEQESSPKKSFS
jgi:hypothetical protein